MTTQPATPGQLTSLLLNARNADGGWGYYVGKSSRLEPTCWALLALRNENASIDTAVLQRWPARDGLLLEREHGEPNYAFHALGLTTLLTFKAEHAGGNNQLALSLQRIKGVKLKPTKVFGHDNTLQAWPWMADTFSWVEPTAWCLFALKRFARAFPGSVDSSRIHEGERLLVDRVCKGGGWNVGNPAVFGQDLRPYVPATALVLIAMRDRREEPAIRESLRFLEDNATTERAASTLSLATIALRAYGRPTAALDRALMEQLPTSVSIGNLIGLSQALFSIGTPNDDGTFSI